MPRSVPSGSITIIHVVSVVLASVPNQVSIHYVFGVSMREMITSSMELKHD